MRGCVLLFEIPYGAKTRRRTSFVMRDATDQIVRNPDYSEDKNENQGCENLKPPGAPFAGGRIHVSTADLRNPPANAL